MKFFNDSIFVKIILVLLISTKLNTVNFYCKNSILAQNTITLLFGYLFALDEIYIQKLINRKK
ncbi:hypothetical protein LMANV2_90160 [Leptospira interrogans serovar Manilae]|uniref:Uncharacterized protein n=1 Tax=Leptospira interrogans serovar Manilae TaxID=214675 RepID=A0AAQ1P5J4_LEPIR|nr:hypothetical protein LIMLP_18105 [Leptospira interrogans serovar Manilae]AKP31743.1 hypothetical protein LIMHP_18100 [Leptospira interrogans serovar Manilae]EYU62389.1 hypothetical protein CI00_20855 [Leptospira interrogans serovar Manilae]SOR63966.1 hypothetical protein LMANV2_90160 [Leptospira interrogans serovar Manilae]